MAKLISVVLCKDAVVDKDSGHVFLFTIVEGLTGSLPSGEAAASTPLDWGLIVQPVVLFVDMQRSNWAVPESAKLRVTIRGPEGQLLPNATETAFDLVTFQRTRNFIQMDGLPFVSAGKHDLLIEIGRDSEWTAANEVPYEITIEPAVD